MKRIGEIKQRREHVFWKQRLVHDCLIRPSWLISLSEWLQLGRRSVYIVPKRLRKHPQSDLWNLWLWKVHKQKKHWRKSGYPSRIKALSYKERAERWTWISTKLTYFGAPFSVRCSIYCPCIWIFCALSHHELPFYIIEEFRQGLS